VYLLDLEPFELELLESVEKRGLQISTWLH